MNLIDRMIRNPLARSRMVVPLLLALAGPLSALAQETCGSDPTTASNHTSNYILGTSGGVNAAMHWNTGLVWQRCAVGQSGADCSGGSATIDEWNDWMASYIPKSFTGQDDWWGTSGGYTPAPVSGPVGVDRLVDGTWRMPYKTELFGLTSGCTSSPQVNRTVFPGTPAAAFWSASPVNDSSRAIPLSFDVAYDTTSFRHGTFRVRLVRGGQSFATLTSPAAKDVPGSTTTSFTAITLASTSGGGEAWGGARISGDGSPEFSLDGGTTWVTEAIVKSGDAITVRMTAGAAGSTRNATLTLRSGTTTGTPDGITAGSCPSCGSEATAVQETTATFTANGVETCGSDPATASNHTANYILGTVGGTAAAMHWNTGLVWQRCAVGQSGADCSGGSATTDEWNDWMASYTPKSFTGQNTWWATVNGYTPSPTTGPTGVNRLIDGAWRLPYKSELQDLTTGCSITLKYNRTVFLGMPSLYFWTASPRANDAGDAWKGPAGYEFRSSASYARFVRGGQSFAALTSPAALDAAVNTATSFGAITLASSSGGGESWGGARISGDGGPEFSLDGGTTWVTEAIVKSGDAITVRLTSGAAGSTRNATLTLRSGTTTGTADGSSQGNCPSCTNEATAMQGTTATFTVNSPVDGTCGTAHGVATLDAPTTNLCASGTAGAVTSGASQYTWACAGQHGGLNANCAATRLYPATDPPTRIVASPGSTVTLTGTTPVTASPGSTLVIPTSANVAGVAITLAGASGGGAAEPIVFKIGSLTLTLSGYTPGTVVSFKKLRVNGVDILVLVVTSGKLALSGKAGQPLLTLNGTATLTAGTDGTAVGFSANADGSGTIAVTAGHIVLSADAFARRGAAAHRAALANGKMYAGELANFDASGQIVGVRLGSAPGTSGGAGDALSLNPAPNLSFSTTVPQLDKPAARLGKSVQEALAEAAGGTVAASQTNGVLALDFGGMRLDVLPLGEVVIDTAQADGARLAADGTATMAAGGVVARFAASVADLGQLARDLAGPFPWPSVEVRPDGVLLVDILGQRYAARLGWTSEAADADGFGEVDGELVYGQHGRRYTLRAAVADWTKLAAAVAAALPGATLQTNADGTVTVAKDGQGLTLKPEVRLGTAPAGTRDWWAESNGMLGLRNANGTMQRLEPQ